MATVEELTEYLKKQDALVVKARAKVLRDLEFPSSKGEARRLVHLFDRYDHFLQVIFCVKRFLEGEEIDLCQD